MIRVKIEFRLAASPENIVRTENVQMERPFLGEIIDFRFNSQLCFSLTTNKLHTEWKVIQIVHHPPVFKTGAPAIVIHVIPFTFIANGNAPGQLRESVTHAGKVALNLSAK